MQVGGWQVDPVIDGEVFVPRDMVYPVPEEAWAPHEELMKPYGTSSPATLGGYLLRGHDRVVLVDAGVGPKAKYPCGGGGLRSSLIALGVMPDQVTDVLFTHLHYDHIGWASREGEPFFTNATYRFDQRDWDWYTAADYESPEWELIFTYPDEDLPGPRLGPVIPQTELFTGTTDLFPGLRALDATGHTPGSTVFELDSEGERAMLLGDLVHTIPELLENWPYSAHLDFKAAEHSLLSIREQLVEDRIPFAAAHFPGLPWGTISRDEDGTHHYHKI